MPRQAKPPIRAAAPLIIAAALVPLWSLRKSLDPAQPPPDAAATASGVSKAAQQLTKSPGSDAAASLHLDACHSALSATAVDFDLPPSDRTLGKFIDKVGVMVADGTYATLQVRTERAVVLDSNPGEGKCSNAAVKMQLEHMTLGQGG